MGIGSITSAKTMTVMQVAPSALKDQKSKSIQNEITEVRQQMQKLSSKEDLSANEKTNERKKLQKEISGLTTELKQHQDDLLRSQKREQMLAKLWEDKKPVKEDISETDTRSEEEASNTTDKSDQSYKEQPSAQTNSIIAQNSDGTVILKEITGQDRNSDRDTKTEAAVETEEEVHDETETNTNDDAAADFRPSSREIQAMVTSDSSLQQTRHLGTIISKTSDGIAILKEEIEQAKELGLDTELKQAELKKIERQEQLAMAFQFSILGEADKALQSAANPQSSKDKATDRENNAYINALNLSREEYASQQKFYVSFV
mgnify:CR=1 FL=1